MDGCRAMRKIIKNESGNGRQKIEKEVLCVVMGM